MSVPVDPTISNATSTNGEKKKPPSVTTIGEVLVQLRRFVDAQTTKNTVASVEKLLSAHIAEEVTTDVIEEITRTLGCYSQLYQLALRLVCLTGKPNKLVKAVRTRLRMSLCERLSYPIDGTTRGENRLTELINWINKSWSEASTSENFASDKLGPFCHNSLTCLTLESDSVIRDAAIQHLLLKVAGLSEKRISSQGFLKEAVKLISSPKMNPAKFTVALQLTYPWEERVKLADESALRATLYFEESRQEIARLRQENERLNSELTATQGRLKSIEGQALELAQQVEYERAKIEEIEEHWEKRVVQELVKQRHQLCNQLKHDLQEARLALDRSEPSVEMALSRIATLEETLEEALRKLES
jgi:hypothetical protein